MYILKSVQYLMIICLDKPLGPQYGGGIVVNPELNHGLKGWRTFGEAKIEHQESKDGNKFIIASKRNEPYHTWLQVSHGNADIAAVFKTQSSYETAGWVVAQKGCWSMLKGGLVVNVSGPADLYFESNNTKVDVWADSVSLQPFTHEEWKSHQDESIEKFRKQRVKFQAVDQHNKPIANATVTITQTNSRFPFGSAINANILSNAAYQKWFTSRFKYATEINRGVENYAVSDALVRFAKSHGMAIRGHNVFWDNPIDQPNWVGGLSPNDLRAAASKRIKSVMRRYKGQFFHWDVVNENLHFSFFESKLGGYASTDFYKTANYLDPRPTPFLNEYNTIEVPDGAASPYKYLEKISQLRAQGYKGPLGIGLQGHFGNVNLPFTRAALDTIASARLPTWVTELDVHSGPNQIHSHAAVQGIILWTAWSPGGCYRMCLTDNNFRNLPTGNVVDTYIRTFTQGSDGITDPNGFFQTSLYHGQYEAKISHPNGRIINKSFNFNNINNVNDHQEAEPEGSILNFKITV
ncbi:hypothetical protein ACJIZ3_015584 [Penstemon smallii]|uniref:GH10 domain-containing protein n=1 Tax=Penstemon smallii TaxID=265156 RepID=A0ABD3RTJ0_9LAMI